MALIQLPTDKSYIAHEAIVANYWTENHIMEHTIEATNDYPKYRFTDGPPFVSGMLHMGHYEVGRTKDSILRYLRSMGFKSWFKMGYDCHGLPAENAVCKKYNLTSYKDMYLDDFISSCNNLIDEYSTSWQPVFEKIGRWAEFSPETTYFTKNIDFMESVWWGFSEMWKKNLIYRGYKLVAYSWKEQTPLSNFEADQQEQKDDTIDSIYVGFQLKEQPNTYIVAWTTTPWTLPSNVALCVSNRDDIKYVRAYSGDKSYIISLNSIPVFQQQTNIIIDRYEIIGSGKELEGLEYQPLFSYINFTYHKVICDEFVLDTDANSENSKTGGKGTGIVHIAPAFGQDDYDVCIKNNIISVDQNIDCLCPIDDECKFTSTVSDYVGRLVFDVDPDIIEHLSNSGNCLGIQRINHKYPMCPRSNTKLVYRIIKSFFVRVSALKERMIELNKTINWYPAHIGENKFGNWLTNARDWALTRTRAWGNPIPVWVSDDGVEMYCVGSIDELMKLANLDERPTDLHKNFLKNITIISPNTGKTLYPCNDVFDCWFESGSVPFAQHHYPFENKDLVDSFVEMGSMTDLIIEGTDQTRGWFYTLLVISTALFNVIPSKNIVVCGLVLDENGKKMSKSLGNVVDPMEVINEFGADFCGLYLLNSPLIKAEPLCFKKDDIKQIKQTMTPFINAVKFLIESCITYEKEQNKNISLEYNIQTENLLDKWILEKVSNLKNYIVSVMTEFRVDQATCAIIKFVDDLTNNYIKFNRTRMKGVMGEEERLISLSVLLTVLYEYTVIANPFMPFLCENIYGYIKCILPEHLQTLTINTHMYPNQSRQYNLESPYNLMMNILELVRKTRDTSKTHSSVRKPIKKCKIYCPNAEVVNAVDNLLKLVSDDLNIMDYEYLYLDHTIPVEYEMVINKKETGMNFKTNKKQVEDMLMGLSQDEMASIYANQYKLEFAGQNIILGKHFDITKKRCIHTDENEKASHYENVSIVVDLTYNEEIHYMCEMRKAIAVVQKWRKDNNLKPWNKISVKIDRDSLSHNGIIWLDNYTNLFSEKVGYELQNGTDGNECVFELTHYDNKTEKVGFYIIVFN